MKKGIWTYIVSGVLGVVAVVGLLLLLFLPKNTGKSFEPVNLYVEDIVLQVGQTKTDFYQISAQDYQITFQADRDGVIEIDENKIVAIDAGKVNVKVSVNVAGNTIEESFCVTVLATSWSYMFENLTGCVIEGDNIVLSNSVAQFKIKCFDENGLEITNPTIETVASDGVDVSYEFGIIKITASKSGVIEFSIAQSQIEFSMNVIKN